MNITKIQFNANESIVAYESSVDATENITTLKCQKARDPAFTKAFNEIIPMIVTMLDLPSDWDYGETEIRDILIDHGAKHDGYKVTLLRKHPWFKTPIQVKTPTFMSDQMPENLEYKLIRIQEHAKEFVNGKRAQRDAFETDSPEIEMSKIDTATGEIYEK